jgi:hypothetical protein
MNALALDSAPTARTADRPALLVLSLWKEAESKGEQIDFRWAGAILPDEAAPGAFLCVWK